MGALPDEGVVVYPVHRLLGIREDSVRVVHLENKLVWVLDRVGLRQRISAMVSGV